jgi:acyl dehydratase
LGDVSPYWFSAPFDDLTLGLRFQTLPWSIADDDVRRFVELTGDTHPQHTDPDWAAVSFFGERIVPGMLVASMAIGRAMLDPDTVVAASRIDQLTFDRPVRLGIPLSVDGEILQLTVRGVRHGLVSIGLVVLQEDVVVVHFRVELLWKRGERPGEVST